MTPEALEIIVKVIREVNQKVLVETEEEGIKKGKKETQLEIAQKLKKTMNDEHIAYITDLPLEKIQNI